MIQTFFKSGCGGNKGSNADELRRVLRKTGTTAVIVDFR
jgi:hypothetical protein